MPRYLGESLRVPQIAILYSSHVHNYTQNTVLCTCYGMSVSHS